MSVTLPTSTTSAPTSQPPSRGDLTHRALLARAEHRIRSAAAFRGSIDHPAVLAIVRRYEALERAYLASGTWSDDPELTVLATAVTEPSGRAA